MRTTKGFQNDVRRRDNNTLEKSTDIHFDNKTANQGGRVSRLTTKFHKIAKNMALLYPEIKNMERNSFVQP